MTKHTYGLGCFGGGSGNYSPETKTTQTESQIVNAAVKGIKKVYKDAIVIKIHGGGYQRAGIPDLYIALRGKSIWIEMKRPGADTTLLQRRKLEELYTAGIPCGTAESTETVLEIIKNVLD